MSSSLICSSEIVSPPGIYFCRHTQVPIRCPARGRHCKHLQCFDLSTFFAFVQQRARKGLRAPWPCALCDVAMNPSKTLSISLATFNTLLIRSPDLALLVCTTRDDGTCNGAAVLRNSVLSIDGGIEARTICVVCESKERWGCVTSRCRCVGAFPLAVG